MSPIDLQKADSFGEREVNFIYFLRWDCPNHSRRLISKRQIYSMRERQMNFIHLINESLKIIDDDGSRKYILMRWEREVNLTHLRSTRLIILIIVDDWSRKDRLIRGERSELDSRLIVGIVLIILDGCSRKDRFIRGEKGTWLYLNRHWSYGC